MVKSLAGLTGENIAKIAYAQHSIPPSGMGAVCEVLIYVFLAICTTVVGLRVYVRMFRVQNDVKWRLNDYLAVAGFVCLLLYLTLTNRLSQNEPILTTILDSFLIFRQQSSERYQSTMASAHQTRTSTTTKCETLSRSAAWNI